MGFSMGVTFMFISIIIYTLSPYSFAANRRGTPRSARQHLRQPRNQPHDDMIPYTIHPSNLINIY